MMKSAGETLHIRLESIIQNFMNKRVAVDRLSTYRLRQHVGVHSQCFTGN